MCGCCISCLTNPDPSFLLHIMSSSYAPFLANPDVPSFHLFGFIRMIPSSWIVWHLLFYFKPPMTYQQDSSFSHHQSFQSIINLQSLPDYILDSSCSHGISTHYSISFRILTSVSSIITLICFCTSESLPTDLLFIVSWNVLLPSQVRPFLSAILVL